jgi:hypothetical protein
MSPETPPHDFKFSRRAANQLLLTEPLKLRLGLVAFGGFLALCGIWLLFPALILHKTIPLPLDRNSAFATAAYRPAALIAAGIGGVRGDLWAQAAFTDAALIWPDRAAGGATSSLARLASAKSDAETALAWAPVNGAAWLFLSLLPAAKPNAGDARTATLLQMSYFTAPNDLILAPLRLERAITSSALLDKDIQEFVKSDLRLILTNRPEQQAAIIAAYRAAPPQNQAMFETIAAEVDSAFGQSLRGGAPK